MARTLITKRPDYFSFLSDDVVVTDSLNVLENLPNSIGVDTETDGLFPYKSDMFSIQIGTYTDFFIVDLISISFSEVIPYIKDKVLVGHNLSFDIGFFMKHNFFPKKVYDTFVVSKILYNNKVEVRHSLKDVLQRELGITLDKTSQKNISYIKLSNKASVEYAFKDVEYLLKLRDALVKKTPKSMTKAIGLHNKMSIVLAYVEQCGLPLNKECWQKKYERNLKKLKEVEAKIIDYLEKRLPKYIDKQGDLFSFDKKLRINLNSDKEMIPVFLELGIDVFDKEKGKYSLSSELLSTKKDDFSKLYVEYTKLKKNISTYGISWFDYYHEGRVYSKFKPLLKSARISTSDGAGILTIPKNKEDRICIRANEGYKIVSADYSGQENVVGADLHRDPVMVSSILEGKDLHCAFARVLFPELKDLSDDEIKEKHKDKRTYAKSPRFALAYGGNGMTIAVNLGVSKQKGFEIEKKFKELHYKMYEWAEEHLNKAIDVGYIESAWGFRIYLPNYKEFQDLKVYYDDLTQDDWDMYKRGKRDYLNKIKSDDYYFYLENRDKIKRYSKLRSDYFKMALNIIIQSTSAFQTKLALAYLYDDIINNNRQWEVRIALPLHDEIVLEVKEKYAEEYKEKLEYYMVKAGNLFLTSGILKMKADAEVGDSWYDTK